MRQRSLVQSDTEASSIAVPVAPVPQTQEDVIEVTQHISRERIVVQTVLMAEISKKPESPLFPFQSRVAHKRRLQRNWRPLSLSMLNNAQLKVSLPSRRCQKRRPPRNWRRCVPSDAAKDLKPRNSRRASFGQCFFFHPKLVSSS